MANPSMGYRSLPMIPNPANAKHVSPDEFDALEKQEIDKAPSMCDGHSGTTVWYAGQRGYVVEVRLVNHEPIRVESICTFTPTFGMDRIDGMIAQDVEEYILSKELGRPTNCLDVYGSNESVDPIGYLHARGLTQVKHLNETSPKRPWWKFW